MSWAAGSRQRAAVRSRHIPLSGILALSAIGLFVGSSLVALAIAGIGQGGSLPSAYLWRVARFTLR